MLSYNYLDSFCSPHRLIKAPIRFHQLLKMILSIPLPKDKVIKHFNKYFKREKASIKNNRGQKDQNNSELSSKKKKKKQ